MWTMQVCFRTSIYSKAGYIMRLGFLDTLIFGYNIMVLWLGEIVC